MTLNDKIEELEKKVNDIWDKAEKDAEEIEAEIEQLKKLACPSCEGLGVYTFRLMYPDFYHDTCPDCRGTGFIHN
jgi:DnaJ-class molecular chaperone